MSVVLESLPTHSWIFFLNGALYLKTCLTNYATLPCWKYFCLYNHSRKFFKMSQLVNLYLWITHPLAFNRLQSITLVVWYGITTNHTVLSMSFLQIWLNDILLIRWIHNILLIRCILDREQWLFPALVIHLPNLSECDPYFLSRI